MRTSLASKTKKYVSTEDLLGITLQSPGCNAWGKCLPLPLRICLSADLYPSVYLPDLTTSARRAAMDSVDFAAFDFFVGAMESVGGRQRCLLFVSVLWLWMKFRVQNIRFLFRSPNQNHGPSCRVSPEDHFRHEIYIYVSKAGRGSYLPQDETVPGVLCTISPRFHCGILLWGIQFRVEVEEGELHALIVDYQVKINAVKAFEAGDVLIKLEGLTKGEKTFTTLQCGLDDYREVGSDFVFCNDIYRYVFLVKNLQLNSSIRQSLLRGEYSV